jgi:hypothetical protein
VWWWGWKVEEGAFASYVAAAPLTTPVFDLKVKGKGTRYKSRPVLCDALGWSGQIALRAKKGREKVSG